MMLVVVYMFMEAMLILYALIVLPAAIAFTTGALIYVALPNESLVAATLDRSL
jgi:archaellum biogenesis protein FlaJ (TadC family)